MHCLKYGLTANNLLGIEIALITGELIRLGGKHLDSEAYDLMGVVTGSEDCSASSPRSPSASCASPKPPARC